MKTKKPNQDRKKELAAYSKVVRAIARLNDAQKAKVLKAAWVLFL